MPKPPNQRVANALPVDPNRLMRLYLVRHGPAIDREDPDCPAESERFLTEEGIRKTRDAVGGLRAAGVDARLWISSPYVRARQTAHLAAEALEHRRSDIRLSEALLPMADPRLIFKELAAVQPESALLLGHAPHLDRALAFALGWQSPFTQLKKAGIACVELSRWDPPENGVLIWLMTPRQLRRLGR